MTLAALTLPMETFARAGGGGHGGGGGILYIILLPLIIIHRIYVTSRLKKRQAQISTFLATMAQTDPQWAEANLCRIASEKFLLLQTAWSKQDFDTMKKHLMPTLYATWEMDIKSQIARNEMNIMSGVSIETTRIVDVKNFKDDERDEFTVDFDASANDMMFRNDKLVKKESSNGAFREFWVFQFHNGEWLVREVVQSSGWKRFMNTSPVFENRN